MEKENTLSVIQETHKCWHDKKCKAYQELLELSELEDTQLCFNEDQNAISAFETILKYGTYSDCAKAIKFFNTFSIFKQLLEG